jgi:hypothetical protein
MWLIGGLLQDRHSGDQQSYHKLARVYTDCHTVSRKNILKRYYAAIKKEVKTIPRHTYNQNTPKKSKPVKVKVSKPQM